MYDTKQMRGDLRRTQSERDHYIAQTTMWRARAYKWLLIALMAGVGLVFFVVDARAQTEDAYNRAWCAEQGGRAEVILRDRTRVDCLTDTHAVEADFAGKSLKPYEALGQAVHYSRMTGLLPGVLLIVRKPSDCRFVERARRDYGHVVVLVLGLGLQPVRLWTVGDSCA